MIPSIYATYTQKPLILYQLETVQVPILDRNTKAQSYTHLQVRKPYITINSEIYILETAEIKIMQKNWL